MLKLNSLLPRLGFVLNKVKFGKNLRMIGWPFVFRFPDAKIILGNNVLLNSGFFSNLLGLYQRTIIVAKHGAKIVIGDDVSISGATIYSWQFISIGNGTNIGANVKIIDTDFHPIDSNQRRNGNNSAVLTNSVIIGKNVFIGMNVIILKGTTIGDNCVIGAGAVVHGFFEKNTVIAGNPARVIKK